MHHLNRWTPALLAALLATPACFPTIDDGEDGAGPQILLFEASPDAISEGGVALLSWATTGATAVTITAADGTVLDLAGQPAAGGSLEVGPTVTTAYSLLATGNGNATASLTLTVTPPTQPEILSFTGSQSDVYVGGEIALSWQTQGATELSLVSDGGDTVTVARTEVVSGTAVVQVDADVIWTLTAISSVGQAAATVTVGAAPPPVIESFTATPEGPVLPGDEVLISWSVSGAEAIQLSDADGNVIHEAAGLISQVSVFPWTRTAYTLVATGRLGDVEETVIVEVMPEIERFQTLTPTVALGGPIVLEWWTTAATSAEISGPAGFSYQVPLGDLGGGSTTLTAEASGTFTLTARSGSLEAQATLEVTVVGPRVISFVASPPAVAAGGTTTLGWQTEGGSSLEIVDDSGTLVTDSTSVEMGTIDVTLQTTTTYTLTLQNDRGDTANATLTVDVAAGAVIQSFTASPARLLRGESAQLSWTVTDDQLGVSPTLVLTDDLGHSYDLSGAGQNTTAYPVMPTQSGPLTFTLVASTPGMPSFTATASLEVFPPPVLDSVLATPSVLDTQGGTASPSASITWSTRDANRIEVFELDASANRILPAIYTTTAAAEVASGSAPVQPAQTTSYRVVASGALPPGVAGDVTVSVLPNLLTFSASATTIPAGGTVTLNWTSWGAQSATLTRQLLSGGGAVNQAVAIDGSLPLLPAASHEYTLCVAAAGQTDCQALVVRVVQPGALKISEIMADPAAVTDDQGEWFEIVNTSAEPVDLAGWSLEDHRAPYVLPATPMVVPPNGYRVFTRRADPALNGGVTPDHSYGTVLSLRNTDGRLALVFGGVIIDEVIWDTANGWVVPAGGSLSLKPGRYLGPETNNDLPTDWCLSSATFGDGDLGTPGAAPVACATSPGPSAYVLDTASPVAFEDISATGVAMTSALSDDITTQVTLGLGFSMPFFGDTVSDLWISSNGFVSFSDPGGAYYTNQSMPNSSVPNTGLVAGFWDDLAPQTGSGVHVQTDGLPGNQRTIVQWTAFQRFGVTGSITFQIQLFESGDIAVVFDGASGVGSDGSSATLGIEAIGGTEAVLASYNTVGSVSPSTSLLFELQ